MSPKKKVFFAFISIVILIIIFLTWYLINERNKQIDSSQADKDVATKSTENQGVKEDEEGSKEDKVDEFSSWWNEYKEPFETDYLKYPDFYRGAWAPRVDVMRQILVRAEDLRLAGFDSVMIEVEVLLDPQTGNPEVLAENLFIFYAQALKKEGFRVFIILNPAHPNFALDSCFNWNGEDNSSCENQPGRELLDKFTPLVNEWAETAGELDAYGFLPVLEPHTFGGDINTSSSWLQDILPQIRSRFSGKVGALDIMYNTGCGREVIPYPYDYSGYDFIIGGPPAGRPGDMLTEWEQDIAGYINRGCEYVQTYSLESFGLYEWGAYQGGVWYEDVQICDYGLCVNDEEAACITETGIALQEGRENEGLKLSFPLIGPGWTDFDKPAFDLISEWYLRISDFTVTPIDDNVWTLDELIEIERQLAGYDFTHLCTLDEWSDCYEMSLHLN